MVLDPGVLISGLISGRGAPRALLLLWLEGSFELITCSALLSELERVLLRPKFRPYLTVKEARDYAALLRRLSSGQADPEVVVGVTSDPGDDYLVALTIGAGAHFLVSGDPHLTELKQPRVPVLTPRAFLKRIAS